MLTRQMRLLKEKQTRLVIGNEAKENRGGIRKWILTVESDTPVRYKTAMSRVSDDCLGVYLGGSRLTSRSQLKERRVEGGRETGGQWYDTGISILLLPREVV
jgi:hypothetical protein